MVMGTEITAACAPGRSGAGDAPAGWAISDAIAAARTPTAETALRRNTA